MIKAGLLAGVLLSASIPSSLAHPHVWVDAEATLLFDEGGSITAIRHAWTFDVAYSSWLMLGLDLDGDGDYSREETAELAEINVTSLRDFHFFTSMAGAQNTDVLGDLYSEEFSVPIDYHVDFDGVNTTLHFTLPLQRPVTASAHDMVVVDIYDPEYFVAFSLIDEQPIKMAGAPSGCAIELDDPPELDETYASVLSLIPADGIVPPELLSITTELANRARVRCV